MKKALSFALLCLSFTPISFINAQVVNRKANTVTKPVIVSQPPTNNNNRTGVAVKPARPITNVLTADMTAGLAKKFSRLEFAAFEIADPDCKGINCYAWNLTASKSHAIDGNASSLNWKEKLMWRKIPKEAFYGRYEISLLPFPLKDDPSFDGVIRSGTIETKGQDSIVFDLVYTDDANTVPRSPQGRTTIYPANTTTENSFKLSNTTLRAAILTKLSGDNKRTFYIRVIPLNGNKAPVGFISNDVTLGETKWNQAAPPKPAATLYNDYTITAIKYIPVHFANSAYYGCTVVTGYNESAFGSSPMGGDMAKTFKGLYPVGSEICPTPPKDQSWYESAFNGVTGFLEKAIDGASNFYNDTKGYVKGKLASSLCSAAPDNAKSNCEKVAGYAFDGAMVAAGIPPSLPNTDDLTKMAEGQLVDVACDKMESETGIPVPAELREEIKKEFHDKVAESSNSRMVDCGFLRVKPHPGGFFQTGYLEIEITRTGNSSKEKGVAGISISDKTTRTMSSYSAPSAESKNVELSFNLFRQCNAAVPYLANVGDKIKIIRVLEPQESWIWKDKKTGYYSHVSSGPQFGEWYTPVSPTHEGYANSLGFQALCNNSITIFNFGMNIAPGVVVQYNNK